MMWSVAFFIGVGAFAPASASQQLAPPCAVAGAATGGVALAPCEKVVAPVASAVSFAQDPFAWMATKTNDAINSTMGALIDGMDATTAVPVSDPAFLSAFAKAWGLATFLTMLMWLWAVGLRVIRRVHPFEAMGEAFGFLLLSVVATSLAVPAIGVALTLVDNVCSALFSGFKGDMNHLLEVVNASGTTLASPSNNPLLALVLGLLLLAALLFVWLELIVRSAMVLIGLLFSPLVFAGLVNRNLWSISRKWVGVMTAVVLSKYIVFAILSLGAAMMTAPVANDFGTGVRSEISAIVLFVVAVWSSASVARFVPIAGDGVHDALHQRRNVSGPLGSGAARTTAAVAGAAGLSTAIATHAYTGPDGTGVVPVGAGAGALAGATAGAAIGSRGPSDKADGDTGKNSGGPDGGAGPNRNGGGGGPRPGSDGPGGGGRPDGGSEAARTGVAPGSDRGFEGAPTPVPSQSRPSNPAIAPPDPSPVSSSPPVLQSVPSSPDGR
jgi:hypothetical protein